MKLIIDAQMPFRLSQLLKQKGYDVIHTDDLQNKERTTDDEIRNIARKENRIVVSKDLDFLNSYYLKGEPKKLIVITTIKIYLNFFLIIWKELKNFLMSIILLNCLIMK